MQRRTLSLKRLVELGACSNQCRIFEERFGKSVRVTPGLCVRVAQVFDWDWAASHLLSKTALAECNLACDSALAEYNRVCNSALAEYNRVCNSAWAEYERAYNSAWAECTRAHARVFGELYNKDA